MQSHVDCTNRENVLLSGLARQSLQHEAPTSGYIILWPIATMLANNDHGAKIMFSAGLLAQSISLGHTQESATTKVAVTFAFYALR